MCYCEFNDIIASIAALDTDVISIEASRSNMELLEAFSDFSYPNEVGPGIWDIHSPRIPDVSEMADLLRKAAAVLPIENLWVNPDCGLKTRAWKEVTLSLKNMVDAAAALREAHSQACRRRFGFDRTETGPAANCCLRAESRTTGVLTLTARSALCWRKRAPAGKDGPATTPRMQDTLWFKDAIIYELHVRSFYDSTGDGVGDFRGLCEKLGYFEELGVNALWLLPFYPSPMRDDGYDIADYCAVNATYGTLKDFQDFLEEAHRRKIRVIIELVINHTSDQHGWFQRARNASAGSPERDFYVWSDTPKRFQDARVIFKDSETSNWSWDAVAQAYYWHRFSSPSAGPQF